jgi:hypothetical protein
MGKERYSESMIDIEKRERGGIGMGERIDSGKEIDGLREREWERMREREREREREHE